MSVVAVRTHHNGVLPLPLRQIRFMIGIPEIDNVARLHLKLLERGDHLQIAVIIPVPQVQIGKIAVKRRLSNRANGRFI
ncbi:hypothetical protein D3C74_433490 [compost metagenome]